jgi:hypothetical protein
MSAAASADVVAAKPRGFDLGYTFSRRRIHTSPLIASCVIGCDSGNRTRSELHAVLRYAHTGRFFTR